MAWYNNIFKKSEPVNAAPTIDPKRYKGSDPAPLLKQQLTRIKQDIAKWRAAINQAEMVHTPYRVELQRGYLETILNSQVTAAIEKRRNLTALRDFCVVNESDTEDEEAEKLLNTQWFYQIIANVIDARFFGYTLIQLGDIEGDKFKSITQIPRERVIPELNVISTASIYDNVGIQITQEPYWNWLIYATTYSDTGTTQCGLGLLHKVAPYEIFIRSALVAWSEYQQIFGVPVRLGKTNIREERLRSNMAQMLENMGRAAWAVVDTDDTIELVESGGKGGGSPTDAFLGLITQAEKAISKILLGHADALDSTPGKLGAEDSVKEALKEIGSVDAKYVESVINDHVFPKLINLGFTQLVGKRFFFENSEEEYDSMLKDQAGIKAKVDNYKVLADAGFDVPEEFILEQTGIPVTKKEVVQPATDKAFSKEIQNKLSALYAK